MGYEFQYVKTRAVRLAEGLVYILDHIRCKILQVTLSYSFLKEIYVHRHKRLFALFCLSSIFSLGLALMFSTYMYLFSILLLGPLHLLSTYRYLPDNLQPRRQKIIIILLMIIGSISFLFNALDFKVVILISLFASYLGWLNKQYSKFTLLISFLLTSSIVIGAFQNFFVTISIMFFVHNLFAFFYWYQYANNAKESLSALAASIVFTGICIVLMLLPEHLISEISFVSFEEVKSIGAAFLPEETNFSKLANLAILGAFGQHLHYFVWIKIIPDLRKKSSIPLPFKRDLNAMVKEIGPFKTFFALMAFVFFALGAVFYFDLALTLYAGLSFFHVYLEVGCWLLVQHSALAPAVKPLTP